MKNYTEINKILKWIKGRDHNNTDPTKLLQILNILEGSKTEKKYKGYPIRQYLIYSREDLRNSRNNKHLKNMTTKAHSAIQDKEWFKSKGVTYEVIGKPPYRLISPIKKSYLPLLDLDDVVREIKLILKQINVELI